MSISTSEIKISLKTTDPTESGSRMDPPRGMAAPTPARYFRWKGWLDRSLAVVFLIPGIPLIGLLVGIIRITSRGPGIYRQIRVGRNGHAYSLYKLRTMLCEAETTSGPVWTQVRDPRITSLGCILRKLHLDELPQLFNVLRGEMSLIGPRPERPEFVAVLSETITKYTDRTAVLPGITGMAQINLPPDSDLASVRRKVVLDLQYIEQANLLLDVRILLTTGLRIIGCPGALAARLMRLYRYVEEDAVELNHMLRNDRPAALEMTPKQLLSQPHLPVQPSDKGNAGASHFRVTGKPRPGGAQK